jgi:hypothetical protein
MLFHRDVLFFFFLFFLSFLSLSCSFSLSATPHVVVFYVSSISLVLASRKFIFLRHLSVDFKNPIPSGKRYLTLDGVYQLQLGEGELVYIFMHRSQFKIAAPKNSPKARNVSALAKSPQKAMNALKAVAISIGHAKQEQKNKFKAECEQEVTRSKVVV